MAKTNLAYVDQATNDALKRQQQDPTIPSEMKRRATEAAKSIIAGFAIYDGAKESGILEQAKEIRRQDLANFRHNRKKLQKTLGERSITPLAIVPKSAWGRICSESGLFTFSPDSEGRILISTGVLDTIVSRARVLSRPEKCVPWVTGAFALVFTGAVLSLTDDPFLRFIGTVVGSVLGFFIGLWLFEKKEALWTSRFVRLQLFFASKWSHERMLRTLFPKGTDGVDGLSVQLMLPTPPAEVAATLRKAEGLPLKVATVAEAISFAENPLEVLRREHDRRTDVERQEQAKKLYRGYSSYEEWLEKCPIVTTEHGSAVAVIAQFGDFPIEKEVVDRVVNSEFLL